MSSLNELLSSGFTSLFPLPRGQKSPPPAGVTGFDGVDLDEESLLALVTPEDNLGWRLPKYVLGLDFDLYKAEGRVTAQWLSKTLGSLPETLEVSSGSGGHTAFFRVPERDSWAKEAGAGIDIIQHGHRYAVMPPSLHPSGMGYIFRLGGREIPSFMASTDLLADLPSAWVESLQGTDTPDGLKRASKGGLQAFEGYSIPTFRSKPCMASRRALEQALESFRRERAGSRHDMMVKATFAMCSVANKGHSLGSTLEMLYTAWAGTFSVAEKASRDLRGEFVRALVSIPETSSCSCDSSFGKPRRPKKLIF